MATTYPESQYWDNSWDDDQMYSYIGQNDSTFSEAFPDSVSQTSSAVSTSAEIPSSFFPSGYDPSSALAGISDKAPIGTQTTAGGESHYSFPSFGSLGGGTSTFGSNLQPYTYTTQNTGNLQGIINQFSSAADEAKKLNLQREQQVEGIYGQMEQMYAPGGSFGQSYLTDLATQKVRDVGSASQTDISRGLFGLTNRGADWESTVGVSSRAKLEDLRTQGLTGVLTSKANFLQNIENPYPSYDTLANLMMKAAGV